MGNRYSNERLSYYAELHPDIPLGQMAAELLAKRNVVVDLLAALKAIAEGSQDGVWCCLHARAAIAKAERRSAEVADGR